ncbi:hypothetical protein [Saccharothrix variisporea]|uniref:hypothetical protein n=1 Tax=Saccharothrix variisporea TaxID=543527 RepID=UPI001FE284D1|nr:hypothetical protein [Saccharothrix variisporea]
MDESVLDPDGARERMAAWKGRIDKLAADTQAMNDLVAPVRSTREAWTGSGLADSIEGLVDAIKTEGWVDDALAGAALGVEVAATVMDPISALLANGLGGRWSTSNRCGRCWTS